MGKTLSSLLALFLLFQSALPAQPIPISALRIGQVEQNHQKSGLEQNLRSDPAAGLESGPHADAQKREPPVSPKLQQLVRNLGGKGVNTSDLAVKELIRMGPGALPAIPLLLERFARSGKSGQQKVQTVLHALADSHAPVEPYFVEALSHSTPGIQREAARYLSIEFLCEELAANPQPAARQAAAYELGNRVSLDSLDDLQRAALRDESEEVRRVAQRAMDRINEIMKFAQSMIPGLTDLRSLKPAQLQALELMVDPALEPLATRRFGIFLRQVVQTGSVSRKQLEHADHEFSQLKEIAPRDGSTAPFFNKFAALLSALEPPRPSSLFSSAGLEATPAWDRYQRETEAIGRKMEGMGQTLKTGLTPGEIWTLNQIADDRGHIILVPLDQNLKEWIPPLRESLEGLDPDQVYRLGIAAGLNREIRGIKRGPQHSSRNACFLFGQSLVRSSDFRRLRSDSSAPLELKGLLGEGGRFQDLRFFVQGEDPTVDRWKPAEPAIGVQEAILLGAVGIKDNLMLGIDVEGHSYHPYWERLARADLQFIEKRLEAITEGRGIGYIAGAVLWAAPPQDFIPYRELGQMGRSVEEWQADYRLPEPTWALEAQMKDWMESDQKKDLEATPEFARAHQRVVERIVERWSATPGITLVMVGGPYFAQTPGQWRERQETTAAAIQQLAGLHEGSAKGKVLPYTRGRDWTVYYGEWKQMAEAGLTPGIVAGRGFLAALLGADHKFLRLDGHTMKNAARRGAMQLLLGLDFLQEKKVPGIWAINRISPLQLRGIREALTPNRTTAGLESLAERREIDLSA